MIPNNVLEKLKNLEEIARQGNVSSGEILEMTTFLPNCFDENIPSHEKSLWEANLVVLRPYLHINDDTLKKKFYSIGESVVNLTQEYLMELGYRVGIETPVENKILGTGPYTGLESHSHVPSGITRGKLTIAEASKARKLAVKGSAFRSYFNLEKEKDGEFLTWISLENLDNGGVTIGDPVLLDDNLKRVPTTYSNNFPSRRPDLDRVNI
jgi:hypothetical protein